MTETASNARLTREQQACVARALVDAAGTIVEFCHERFEGTSVEDVPATLVAEQLARWLRRLPGDVWDTRLPDPTA